MVLITSGGTSAKGASVTECPSHAGPIASACVSRPGPEQSARSGTLPRRRRISSNPWVGSSARNSTAAANPSGPHTTFTHQWTPYER